MEPLGNQSNKPELWIEAHGGLPAFLVKLEANVQSQRQAAKAKLDAKWRVFKIVTSLIGTAWVIFTLTYLPLLVLSLALGVIILIAAGICALWLWFYGNDPDKGIARDAELLEMLKALAPDLHPRSALAGFADLAEAWDTEPEDTADSPYSGALKCYYRHHFASFSCVLADGSVLAIALIDKVKTKSGNELKREHQLLGRLVLAGGRYDEAAIPRRFEAEGLRVERHRGRGHVQLIFGGVLEELAGLPEALAAILAWLEPKEPLGEAS